MNRIRFYGDPYHPNAGIDSELIEYALRSGGRPFQDLGITPQIIYRDGSVIHGMIQGTVDGITHLVYVRVTLNDQEVTGTGPVPGILIDTARELQATPHLVRVHLQLAIEDGEETIASSTAYGIEELDKTLKATRHWRRRLLRGRSARELLQLTGGRTATLTLHIHNHPPEWRQCSTTMVLRKGKLQIIRPPRNEWVHWKGWVYLRVSVDTLTPSEFRNDVAIANLVSSAISDDEHFILLCECNSRGCGYGVNVVHEDGLVAWLVRGISPRRIVVFDREQYRNEIYSKVREALGLYKAMLPEAIFGMDEGFRVALIEDTLHRIAAETLPARPSR